MTIIRQYIAPFIAILVFFAALVAVSARIFLPSDMAAPAPIEEAIPQKQAAAVVFFQADAALVGRVPEKHGGRGSKFIGTSIFRSQSQISSPKSQIGCRMFVVGKCDRPNHRNTPRSHFSDLCSTGTSASGNRCRGDRQIGLQVFLSNQPALNLYQKLGYQSHSLWMLKSLWKGNGEWEIGNW